MKLVPVFVSKQDRYRTVAEGLQAAVASLLDEAEMKYYISFYYWAAFLPHGFGSVKLDDALLDQIHDRVEALQQQQESAAAAAAAAAAATTAEEEEEEGSGQEKAPEMAMLTLARDVYHRLEDREQTLSREWCEKWGAR